jgi:hypothetical protein
MPVLPHLIGGEAVGKLAGKLLLCKVNVFYYVKHTQCQKNFVNFIEFTIFVPNNKT